MMKKYGLRWKEITLIVCVVVFIVGVIMVNDVHRLRKDPPPEEYLDISTGVELRGSVSEANHPKCLVSYVMFAPKESIDKTHQTCINNAHVFLSRGVVKSSRIDYVFNLVGDTTPTDELSAAARSMSNVNISRVPNQAVDLLSHLNTIMLSKRRYKYYILLNCGARGPYFTHLSDVYPLKPSMIWISHFTDPLRKGASAVGSTISPELSSHIQTYAMALNYKAAQFAVKYWGSFNGPTSAGNDKIKTDLIANLEVGLSRALVEGGFKIASLDTRMQNLYSRKLNIAGGMNDNPTSCRITDGKGSSGCEGVDPCEVVFVKYGGEIMKQGLIPHVTLDRFEMEDKNAEANKPHMCTHTRSYQYWDVPWVFKLGHLPVF